MDRCKDVRNAKNLLSLCVLPVWVFLAGYGESRAVAQVSERTMFVWWDDAASAMIARGEVPDLLERMDGRVDWMSSVVPGLSLVEMPMADSELVREVVRHIPGVTRVEVDAYAVHPLATPNDPNFGPVPPGPQWNLTKSRFPEAWDIRTDASGVLVAVIDYGVNYTISDLASNLEVNSGELVGGQFVVNGIDEDNNGYPDDYFGYNFNSASGCSPLTPYWDPSEPCQSHGTGVSSLFARGNNNLHICGGFWTGRILAVKSLSSGPQISLGSFRQSLRVLVFRKLVVPRL
jgi:subtilisin family serine protease